MATNSHLATAVDGLTQALRLRFRWVVGAAVVLVLAVLVQSYFYKQEADTRAAEARAAADQLVLIQQQQNCYVKVQGHYVLQIGLLADNNGKSLRGEPIDPPGNIARVKALRAASVYVDDRNLDRICFQNPTGHPDGTPTDGDIDNDGKVDIEIPPGL